MSDRIALVLMTALPPTIGHAQLINFAKRLVYWDGGMVHVIFSSRSCEPFEHERYQALHEAFDGNGIRVHWHADDDAPQNPKTAQEWLYWKKICERFCDRKLTKRDFFVASETYGLSMAELLDCSFMPYDMHRLINPVKATKVRRMFRLDFDKILPEFQKFLVTRVTIFGAESCGKTTVAKQVAGLMGGTFVPEWARDYLETVGTEITEQSMRAICTGQRALQSAAPTNRPLIIQDTDLFTTLGYYRICRLDPPPSLKVIAERMKSDLYLIVKDNIPFDPDPIRYGVFKRERDFEWWLKFAQEMELNYKVIDSVSHYDRNREADRYISEFMDNNEKFVALRKFERE